MESRSIHRDLEQQKRKLSQIWQQQKIVTKIQVSTWWNIVGSCHLYSLQSSWFRLLRARYSQIDRISWKCGSVIQRHVTKIMTKIIWKTINHILPTWGVPVACASLYDVRTSPIPQTITHTQTHSRASPNVWAGVLHCTYTCSFEIVNHPFHHVYVLCVCVYFIDCSLAPRQRITMNIWNPIHISNSFWHSISLVRYIPVHFDVHSYDSRHNSGVDNEEYSHLWRRYGDE